MAECDGAPLCQLYASFSAINTLLEADTGCWQPCSMQQIMDQLQLPNRCSQVNHHLGPKGLNYFHKSSYFGHLNSSPLTTESNYPLNYVGERLTKQEFSPSKVKAPTVLTIWKSISGVEQMVEALKTGPIVGYLNLSKEFKEYEGSKVLKPADDIFNYAFDDVDDVDDDSLDAYGDDYYDYDDFYIRSPPLADDFDGSFSDDDSVEGPVYHALVIMGHGTGPDGDYWIVQNSWGESWGIGGVGYIAKGINLWGIEGNAYMIYKGPDAVDPPCTQ